MRIYFYTLCKNEEELLPHMLKHYQQFVDRIFIFVNVPINDRSNEIIDSHPLCTRYTFDTQGKLRDDVHVTIKNNCWKESAGEADWVIVADLDEFLFHRNLIAYLEQCSKEGVTVPLTRGFDMFSSQMPVMDRPITEQIRMGVYNPLYSKCIVFDPNKIHEINYTPGAHTCRPEGYVKYSKIPELKLLHYKYIGGLERLRQRWNVMGNNLSEENIRLGMGIKRKDQGEIDRLYEHVKQNATQVI